MQPSPGTISVPSPNGRPCTMRRKVVHMARGMTLASQHLPAHALRFSATARIFRISSCTCSRRGAGRVDALVSRMLWTEYECTFAAVTALQRRALWFVLKSFAQARKALDRLRKLSSLKFFASKTQAKMTGEPIEISPAKRKELKELFSLIDEDGSGEVRRVCS